MLFKSTIFAVMALLLASSAVGSPATDATQIATDPSSACNCPRNCDHRSGSSCKYYSGPSDKSSVISGVCQGNPLKCKAT